MSELIVAGTVSGGNKYTRYMCLTCDTDWTNVPGNDGAMCWNCGRRGDTGNISSHYADNGSAKPPTRERV